jgi:hypothetical protein
MPLELWFPATVSVSVSLLFVGTSDVNVNPRQTLLDVYSQLDVIIRGSR